MLEMWGGIECTVTRVGARRVDEVIATGHEVRADDLKRCAALGIKALRYPVVWERVAPRDPAQCDWRWTDARLAHLRELGIRPIVGLVHHGAGPDYAPIDSDRFAPGLAAFAARAAARYPWVEDWVPVNEPLTTARFCGLYGLWYPHGRDDATFLRLLFNELAATRLAMAAIRTVIPSARLVQTDDLGHTWATPPLRKQARFENARRWLGWDVLTGRIDARHVLRPWLRDNGIASAELDDWCANPCPPDVIGINHYLSSERFIDHRLERYPPVLHGGNDTHAYADIEAHRVLPHGALGVGALLRAAWQRYRLPLAITEVHNGCTREEQLRWFAEVWRTAQQARAAGIDVRAVTAWSLFGAVDWNSMLTRAAGHYEPGVYDIRAPRPRPTAMVGLISDLAHGRPALHPVLHSPGWWRRTERGAPHPHLRRSPATRSLVIIGARGTLGQALARAARARALPHHLLARAECDIAGPAAQLETTLAALRPWAVINTAGCVDVDLAEREPARCWRDNSLGAQKLARACARLDIPLVGFSSDLVFDGAKDGPYVEGDRVAPLSHYGRSKAAAEDVLVKAHARNLVVRTSAFFSPHDSANFAMHLIAALDAGRPFAAVADVRIAPTYVPDLVDQVLDLLIDGATGLWHLANRGEVSWHEFALALAAGTGRSSADIQAIDAAAAPWQAPRPRHSVLASERATLMPALEHAILRFAAALG